MNDIVLRPACQEDARALAILIDIAGEGLPKHIWSESAGPGESALDIGMRRAQREEGGFSYRNATLAELGGEIAGLLLGYPLAEPYDIGDLAALPPFVRPLVELESLAAGSWYVNALACFPEHRGRGIGSMLLAEAERIARAQNVPELSLIVAEENPGAVRLYRREGYSERARRPLVPFPGLGHAGDWLLMVKRLS